MVIVGTSIYSIKTIQFFEPSPIHLPSWANPHYIVVTAPSTLTYSSQPFHVKYEPSDPKVNGCDFSPTTLVLFGRVSGQPIKGELCCSQKLVSSTQSLCLRAFLRRAQGLDSRSHQSLLIPPKVKSQWLIRFNTLLLFRR
ncbi:hypothetical protein Pyn_01271 [Prunus yedoensis var. nudiflora]|uniref:Uncharacterized protein n=1 Tax=Prunus yedoensis var. nudiflora TaxID=2094558 RepID=A0A314XNC2_PRUYE|nr:hypothetical protein Pyn_01271 [Prunus yedoensis var. nudiflora]